MARPPKKATVKAPLTREEKIAEAIKFFRNDRGYANIERAPSFHCKVGDKVKLGGLIDPIIEEIVDDGIAYVISCFRENRGVVSTERDYGCWNWYDFKPLATLKNSQVTKKPLQHHASATDYDGLMHRILFFGIDDAPDFQRDYVWSHEDKVNLIESIMDGRDIGKFVFVKRAYPHNDYVLDGKQRIEAMMEYRLSKFPVRGCYYHELSNRDEFHMGEAKISYIELSEHTPRVEMLRLFVIMNTTGVPIAPEHIQKVQKMLEEEENGKA